MNKTGNGISKTGEYCFKSLFTSFRNCRKFRFCFRGRKQCKHKRKRLKPPIRAQSCPHVSRTAPKPEVESSFPPVLRIYLRPDSGGCWFQSLHLDWLAAEETKAAGHLTQLWALRVWRHQDMFWWRTGGGSAAAPEPPSLDRYYKPDELEPGAQKGQKKGHGIH